MTKVKKSRDRLGSSEGALEAQGKGEDDLAVGPSPMVSSLSRARAAAPSAVLPPPPAAAVVAAPPEEEVVRKATSSGASGGRRRASVDRMSSSGTSVAASPEGGDAAEARPRRRSKDAIADGSEATDEAKKSKKKRAKAWTAGSAAATGTAALGLPDGRPPSEAFEVGMECVARCTTVVRCCEDLESQEIGQMRKGGRCRVLARGTGATGRRLRILDLESGKEGWISCVAQNGRFLLQISTSSDAAPQQAQAPAAASFGGVHQPEPPRRPSGSSISPQQRRSSAISADSSGAGTAAHAAVGSSPLRRPPGGLALASPAGPPLAADGPAVAAASSLLAASTPAAAAVPSPSPSAVVPAAVPVPSAPALPFPNQARSRMQLISRLFEALDVSKRGRLNSGLLRNYADLCGFDDAEEQWSREYDALCNLYGWSPEVGADARDFAQLVDDEEGAAYCTDEELLCVLDEVERYGVPDLISMLLPNPPAGTVPAGAAAPAGATPVAVGGSVGGGAAQGGTEVATPSCVPSTPCIPQAPGPVSATRSGSMQKRLSFTNALGAPFGFLPAQRQKRPSATE